MQQPVTFSMTMVTVLLATGNAFAELADVPMSTARAASVTTWLRAQRVLLTSPQTVADRPRARWSQSTRDFREAIERQRPHAVGRAGSVHDYLKYLSLDQASTLKGFTYEQSLVRRWNKRGGPLRYELASVNHEFADILEIDNATGAVRRQLQVYSGGNPRAALEKLFISDVEADKLVIPRDCFEKIDDVLDSILKRRRGILSQMETGGLDAATGLHLIRNRLGKIGIQFDADTQVASFRGRTLGRVDDPAFQSQFSKLVKEKLSSDVIYRQQLTGQVETSANFRTFRDWQGGEPAATRLVVSTMERREAELLASGLPKAVAARKARGWVQQQFGRKQIDDLIQSERRARLLGVPDDQLGQLRPQFDGDTLKFKNSIERMGRKAWHSQQINAQAIVLGLTALGAGVDFVLSEKDLDDWLMTRSPEWAARAGVASVAVGAAGSLERKLIERSGSKVVLRSVKTTAIAGGAATALFLAGDTLIAVTFRGAGWAEIRDMTTETAMVLVVTEGCRLGSIWILTAAGYGTWAGPVGIGVSIGTVVIYSGVTHVYTRSQQIEEDRLVIAARCDAARTKVNRWCDEICQRSRFSK